jgi:hypothetical protein
MRTLAVMLLLGCRSATPTGPSEQAAPDGPDHAVPEESADAERVSKRRTDPVVTAASTAAHEAALGRYNRQEPQLSPLHGPPRNLNEPPGIFVPIVNPPDAKALARFHAALAEGRRVRVAMYGASGTAADMAVGYVRTYLQQRFGNGGPGFVPLGPLSKWYRHSEVKVSASKGWMKEHAQIRKGRLDGHYGLLGASFYTTKKKQWVEIKPKSSSQAASVVGTIELYFLAQPGGGSFELTVDGNKKEGTIRTKADAIGPGYHEVDVETGAHSLRIDTVGDGEVRVFGAVFEADEGGVVVDVLGIDGTRSENQLTWNEELWADNFARRGYDLVTLSYGTNESVNEDRDMATYREDLRTVITRMKRVAPQSDCVVLGPVDFPIRDEELGLQERPLLNEIIDAQREQAPKLGCGFWDGVAFMGGRLSMQAWVEYDPPLARKDYLHFTGRGSARKGQAVCDALMLEYDAAARANR